MPAKYLALCKSGFKAGVFCAKNTLARAPRRLAARKVLSETRVFRYTRTKMPTLMQKFSNPVHGYPSRLGVQCRRAFRVSFLKNHGSVLLEVTAAVSLLAVIAMLLMRGSMNALTGRYWTMAQNMSDAYLGYEIALAQRVPMDDVIAGGTLWPTAPATSSTVVEIGRLPGGTPVTATVHRTKVPDPNNLPTAGGTGTAATNPASMEAWKLQSHLVYSIGDNQYRKSRTVVRFR